MEFEYVNEIEMLKSKYFRGLLLEKIRDCNKERNEPLSKMEDIDETKLDDLIKLYSLIKDIDEKFLEAKIYYNKYFCDILTK